MTESSDASRGAKRRCDAARRQAKGGVVVNHVRSHFTSRVCIADTPTPTSTSYVAPPWISRTGNVFSVWQKVNLSVCSIHSPVPNAVR